MKFKSNLFSVASGSLAGTVASHNRGGQYVRNRSTPTNPRTAQQTVVRNAVSQLTTAWAQTLTPAQRDAWTVYANNVPLPDAFGDPRVSPALAWYIKANVCRVQSGLARVDDGPNIYQLATMTPPTATVTLGTSNASVAFTASDQWTTNTGAGLLVYISRPVSQTINFFNGPYRFAGVVLGASTAPTSPATISLPFGSALDATRYFFRFVVSLSDGRPSASVRTLADCNV